MAEEQQQPADAAAAQQQETKRIHRQQDYLWWWLHTRSCCMAIEECVLCRQGKPLFQHALRCRTEGCSHGNCKGMQGLVDHYRQCKASYCKLCTPIKILPPTPVAPAASAAGGGESTRMEHAAPAADGDGPARMGDAAAAASNGRHNAPASSTHGGQPLRPPPQEQQQQQHNLPSAKAPPGVKTTAASVRSLVAASTAALAAAAAAAELDVPVGTKRPAQSDLADTTKTKQPRPAGHGSSTAMAAGAAANAAAAGRALLPMQPAPADVALAQLRLRLQAWRSGSQTSTKHRDYEHLVSFECVPAQPSATLEQCGQVIQQELQRAVLQSQLPSLPHVRPLRVTPMPAHSDRVAVLALLEAKRDVEMSKSRRLVFKKCSRSLAECAPSVRMFVQQYLSFDMCEKLRRWVVHPASNPIEQVVCDHAGSSTRVDLPTLLEAIGA